jgi:hypothetical protein
LRQLPNLVFIFEGQLLGSGVCSPGSKVAHLANAKAE